VAPGVSGTRFANGLRAYERMPQRLRDRIDALNALHVMERVPTRPNRLTDMLPGDQCTMHPVVGHQKGTNRPYLFVNQAMAALVVGLSQAESDQLLDESFSYLYADGAIYEHAWHNGDIVIWDNLAVQHARGKLSADPRTLQRVTIAKTPYTVQHPSMPNVYTYLRTFEKPAA
jgi:taurine dioxygenase